MSTGEIAYVAMAVAALLIFALGLAYASFVAGGTQRMPNRTSTSRNRVMGTVERIPPREGMPASG